MTEQRQRIERVSSRRAKLTPAPGTTTEPDLQTQEEVPEARAGGPNDERMLREVPPHY